jgi:hypothetical protein
MSAARREIAKSDINIPLRCDRARRKPGRVQHNSFVRLTAYVTGYMTHPNGNCNASGGRKIGHVTFARIAADKERDGTSDYP